MRLKTLSIVVVAFMLSACAATLTDRAAKIQVHSQISTLLSTCQKLGPVTGYATATWSEPTMQAKIAAREKVADLGGDTLAITNLDETQSLTEYQSTVHGVAMKCY